MFTNMLNGKSKKQKPAPKRDEPLTMRSAGEIITFRALNGSALTTVEAKAADLDKRVAPVQRAIVALRKRGVIVQDVRVQCPMTWCRSARRFDFRRRGKYLGQWFAGGYGEDHVSAVRGELVVGAGFFSLRVASGKYAGTTTLGLSYPPTSEAVAAARPPLRPLPVRPRKRRGS